MDDSFISLLAILALLFLVAPYIVSALLAGRIGRAERAARADKAALGDLAVRVEAQALEIAALRGQIATVRGLPAVDDAAFETGAILAQIEPPAQTAPLPREEAAEAAIPPATVTAPTAASAPSTSSEGWIAARLRRGGLERQFGAVLPVWIGGIALAFAGFFLVKYSIDNQLVGPETRTVLGVMLGFSLIAGAHWIGYRVTVESAERIAQSLAGAGIAVLYVSAYAASALYELVPPVIGFAGMAGVTAIAVVLSLRHGPPIAMLGLIGGFLTPALIRSDHPSAISLFIYLYLVFAALVFIIRRQNWWPLAIPAVLLSFLWVIAWLLSDAFRPDEVLWAGLFLMAVAATIVAASRERYAAELAASGSWRGLASLKNRATVLNTLSVAGALSLFALLSFNASFTAQDWALFGVLATGGIVLAAFNASLYGYVPWATMAVTLAMLAGWTPGADQDIAITVTAFGALYTASGLILFRSAPFPLLWAALSVAGSLGHYLLAYFRLTAPPEAPLPYDATAPAIMPEAALVPPPALPSTDGMEPLQTIAPPMAEAPGGVVPVPASPPVIDTPPNTQPVEPLAEGVRQAASAIPHLWGAIAFALALLFLGAAARAARVLAPSEAKEHVLAAFALGTTAFAAIGFFVELPGEFLSVAIAAELLAVAWVSGRAAIPALRPIAALLGLCFAFLLAPQMLFIAQLTLYSLFDYRFHLAASIPIVDYPLLQLLLPALMFLAAANLLLRQAQGDGRLVRTLEASAVALIGLWAYYTASGLFHAREDVLFAPAGFLERGIVTSVLFAFGIGWLMAGRRFGRAAFAASGGVLVFTALFRVVYLDLIVKNPLWTHIEVPGLPLAGALAITYGLPILLTRLAAGEAASIEGPWFSRLSRGTPGLMLVLAFAWISFEIRRAYQGAFLDSGAMSDAELYSYSAAWLLFGSALLFLGTLKASQMLRLASLAVMLATISKVFLVDAASLTGLYRVFSFLGLGLSLMGLSYFYSRFVFGPAPREEPAASTDKGEATPPA